MASPRDDEVYDIVDDNAMGPDPWVEHDPWQGSPSRGSSQPQRSDFPRTFTGVIQTAGQEPPPARIIHDIHPIWDGTHPEKELEPYLKLLRGWLSTSRTLKTQRGMIILQHATGDLKILEYLLEFFRVSKESGIAGTILQ